MFTIVTMAVLIDILSYSHAHTHFLFLICNIKDVLFWMKDKQEIEIVDFLLQVKHCIVSERKRVRDKTSSF